MRGDDTRPQPGCRRSLRAPFLSDSEFQSEGHCLERVKKISTSTAFPAVIRFVGMLNRQSKVAS